MPVSPPPRTTASANTLLRLVARLPGAIAYLGEGFSSDELRVLAIGGKLPRDADYPLVYTP